MRDVSIWGGVESWIDVVENWLQVLTQFMDRELKGTERH